MCLCVFVCALARVCENQRLARCRGCRRLTGYTDVIEVLELAIIATRAGSAPELVRAKLFPRVNLVAVGQ